MAPSTSTVLCLYYDPLDRLASTQSAAQESALRFYRKNRLATQIQGAIQHTLFGHDDQLLAQQNRSGKSTETRLLATDQQGSVLHGIDVAGIESRAYNAYGHHPVESGLSCLMGFNGEQRDPVTGHYLLGNGYRAFNPVLMRFNSPDELSPFGRGGLNAYGYCQGDPVNFRDATGRMPLPYTLIDNLDELMAVASRVHQVPDEMDTFIQGLVTPPRATISRPASAPVARASTSQTAMQADSPITTSGSDAREVLLQEIIPKTLEVRELRRAKVRISIVEKSGALEGVLRKSPRYSKNSLRSLKRNEKTLMQVAGHYRVAENVPRINPNILDKYLGKIIITRRAIANYKRALDLQQNQLTIRWA